MFRATYTGPEERLGRFGTVQTGQELRLTNTEAAAIRKDRRFKIRSEVIPTDAERRLEISQIDHAMLFRMCQQARQDRRPIEFTRRYSRAQLIHAWLSMERREAGRKAKAEQAAQEAREAALTLKALTGK